VTPTPEEPAPEGPGRESSENSPEETERPLRGWIDPDDRLWRHPSEVAPGVAAVSSATAPPAGRLHLRLAAGIGALATLAAVAWVIVLLSPASDHPVTSAGSMASDPPGTTLAAASVPANAGAAGQAMVQLQADTAHGVVSLVGVAVAEGGLVATIASQLTDVQRIDMVGSDGRLMRASIVAIDPSSDLALVAVPDDVPVAPFADDGAVVGGMADLTLSMVTPDHAAPAVASSPGSITAVGLPLASGPAAGMPEIASSTTTAGDAQPGDPLLNGAGQVIGILYGGGSAGPVRPPVFLPSQLVLGVADDLRSSGRVDHGWLGVEGSDATGTSGAAVAAVDAASPALGRLHPGEIIVDMGSAPVRSMAELRARLYVLAPATTVALTVIDGAVTRIVDVTLSASP
jgi:S1-C subfamily serine protease